MTPALYEKIYEAWSAPGTLRSKSDLSRAFGVDFAVITRCIEVGYPRKGLVSFKERERIKQAQQQLVPAAVTDKATEVLAEWEKLRGQNLALARGTKAALSQLLKRLVEATNSATFIRTKRIKNPDGTVTEVEVADGPTIVASLKSMAVAIKEIGSHEFFWWTGGKPQKERGDNAAEGDSAKPTGLEAFMSLPDDQLDHIISTGGELPPGVTEEQLMSALVKPGSN